MVYIAEYEHSYSLDSLGIFYLENTNMKDIQKAIQYLTKALKNGSTFARIKLVKIYLNYESFPENRSKAIYHLFNAVKITKDPIFHFF